MMTVGKCRLPGYDPYSIWFSFLVFLSSLSCSHEIHFSYSVCVWCGINIQQRAYYLSQINKQRWICKFATDTNIYFLCICRIIKNEFIYLRGGKAVQKKCAGHKTYRLFVTAQYSFVISFEYKLVLGRLLEKCVQLKSHINTDNFNVIYSIHDHCTHFIAIYFQIFTTSNSTSPYQYKYIE